MHPAELIKVQVAGGDGGVAGPGGKPGAGGKAKGCFVYKADGGKNGRPGAATLGKIRKLVGINLIVGLVLVAIAAARP